MFYEEGLWGGEWCIGLQFFISPTWTQHIEISFFVHEGIIRASDTQEERIGRLKHLTGNPPLAGHFMTGRCLSSRKLLSSSRDHQANANKGIHKLQRKMVSTSFLRGNSHPGHLASLAAKGERDLIR